MIEVYQSVAEQNTITNIEEEDENSDSDLAAVQKENNVLSQSEQGKKFLSRKSEIKFLSKDNQDDELVNKYDYSKIDTKRSDKKIDELSAKYDYSRVAIKRPTNLEKQFNMTANNLANKESDKKASVEQFATARRDDKKQSTIDKRREAAVVTGNAVVGDKSKILSRTNTTGNLAEGSVVMGQRNSERKTSVLLTPAKRDSAFSVTSNKSSTAKPDDKRKSTFDRSNSINSLLI